MSGQPVVFIHGLWIHSAAWEPWLPLYRRAGYEPVVAGWPGDSDTPEATRRAAIEADARERFAIENTVDGFSQMIDSVSRSAPMRAFSKDRAQ